VTQTEPSTPWGPYPWDPGGWWGDQIEQLPDGSWAIVDSSGNVVAIITPPSGSWPQPTEPATPIGPYPWDRPGTPTAPPASTAGKQGGTAAWDTSALKWLASLVLLWLILTALTEYSPNTKMLGQSLAGLILLGALFYLGPGAISNVKNIWTQTGPNPVQGPNPVPGAQTNGST
jgi:hypothetical protein